VLDQDIGMRRYPVTIDRRALRGQYALDIGEVLDRDRQSRKQAALGDRFLHQGLGMGPRAFETERRQRVDLAVDLGNTLFQDVEQVERRDLAVSQLVDDRARGLPHQCLFRQCRFS
jgi:hypothetical protein